MSWFGAFDHANKHGFVHSTTVLCNNSSLVKCVVCSVCASFSLPWGCIFSLRKDAGWQNAAFFSALECAQYEQPGYVAEDAFGVARPLGACGAIGCCVHKHFKFKRLHKNDSCYHLERLHFSATELASPVPGSEPPGRSKRINYGQTNGFATL